MRHPRYHSIMVRPALILLLLAFTLPANAQPVERDPAWDALRRLCIFCTIPVGHPPLPDMPHEAGDIFYRHEVLSGKHLLRLSTTDRIIDTDEWRKKRLFAFATKFADDTCNGHFQPIKTLWQTTTARQFSFRCKWPP